MSKILLRQKQKYRYTDKQIKTGEASYKHTLGTKMVEQY